MKKKILFLLISISISIFSWNYLYSNDLYQTIQPETSSEKKNKSSLKFGKFKESVVVTANDYATKIGYSILEKGGNAIDAAVAIQLTLGLVEPQSSGIGGGLFVTFFDSQNKKVISYEGREKAPANLQSNIFLNEDGQPINFFDAVVGGRSVGVPATLKTLFKMHSDYGKLEWNKIIEPLIEFSAQGFKPPNRLINAINKDKYLFKINPNSIFSEIKKNPTRTFVNNDYTRTLKLISDNILNFYEGNIGQDIIYEVNNSKNPGKMTSADLKNYYPEKNPAFCYRLKNDFKVCGPNLPSSGTICIVQALILFENFFNKNNAIKKKDKVILESLEILNFVYHIRDLYLADPLFESIYIERLINESFLKKAFEEFKQTDKSYKLINKAFDQYFTSTSHFSITDKFGNIVSATSSIENSFGSRLFTNGFFLNNQLTDFSFSLKDNKNNLIKNRPEPFKRPLSSMSPLIIFDKNDNFFLTVGSPGGKAIISYVFKSLVSILYLKEDITKAIESPNYIKIKDRVFIESDDLNDNLNRIGKKRSLTSGLAIIKKNQKYFSAAADSRRDGTVRGN